ncbi:MAG: CotH kinase family protein [Deferribacteres bacterium]|nr:CotH kinase family protein [candidate division KSB1 bacterium]MCB9500653.1 CotH kinase family protein [Deferribacteres bacterium]
MRLSKIFLFTALLFAGANTATFAQADMPRILINEFMAANQSTINNPVLNEYSDWIELFNAGDSLVHLGGWYLTDDLSVPDKWQIPASTTIRPGWRLFFWSDGEDFDKHTNFKLDKAGEQIGLFTMDGQPVDTLTYGEQRSDISYGRYPDGGEEFVYFDQPTPSSDNSTPGFIGFLPQPDCNLASGFYNGAQTLELSVESPESIIRYTLDGSLPTEAAALYVNSLPIDQTVVLRAREFRSSYMPGAVLTRTYLIDEPRNMPVVSLVTEPENLWSNETGIYVEGTNGVTGFCSNGPRNWNQPWERPVHLVFWEKDGITGFELDAGMQIGGGCTRLYQQKSLAIYARSEYGASKIEYPLFPDKNITSFNNLLLRNGGQDFYRTLFRDGFMQTLVKDQMDIDWQAYRPVVVYLNGEYWGIHGLREKHNEHYFAQNYGVDPDKIDLLVGNAEVKDGSATAYNALIDFVKNKDMSLSENYAFVLSQMDMNEYLNYVISEIYFANIDWPANNIKYWRPQSEAAKWRWMLYDTDLGFGAHPQGQYDSNTLENVTSEVQTYYANPTWSTLLFRRLLENETFRFEYIQRTAVYMETAFRLDRTLALIDSFQTLLAPEVPRQKLKWYKSMSFGNTWEAQIDIMREFAEKRPGSMRSHISSKFGLSGTARLNVATNEEAGGQVFLNSVPVPANFSGLMFKDVPVLCKAVAAPGYRFVGWKGDYSESSDSLRILVSTTMQLQAQFEPVGFAGFRNLKINEIMALNEAVVGDEAGEFDDWIELYNSGDAPINIAGLYFTDDLKVPGMWQIPENGLEETIVQPHGFLLLWADRQPAQGALHVDFKLSGDGEALGIFIDTGDTLVCVDSLNFAAQQTNISWGRTPDGGVTLQFFTVPTPGSANSKPDFVAEQTITSGGIDLAQNYPNPFHETTRLDYFISSPGRVQVTIFNSIGKHVTTLIDRQMPAGQHEIIWDGMDKEFSRVAAGIYFCRLQVGEEVRLAKMVFLP